MIDERELAVGSISDRIWDHLTRWLDDALEECQSPIEVSLACALVRAGADRFGGLEFGKFRAPYGYAQTLEIDAQHPIQNYTADFFCTLTTTLGVSASIVVECDGHDYHERTKDQAMHDKKRDRFMVSRGYRVFRYTGREIHRDAGACAKEVCDILWTTVKDRSSDAAEAVRAIAALESPIARDEALRSFASSSGVNEPVLRQMTAAAMVAGEEA